MSIGGYVHNYCKQNAHIGIHNWVSTLCVLMPVVVPGWRLKAVCKGPCSKVALDDTNGDSKAERSLEAIVLHGSPPQNKDMTTKWAEICLQAISSHTPKSPESKPLINAHWLLTSQKSYAPGIGSAWDSDKIHHCEQDAMAMGRSSSRYRHLSGLTATSSHPARAGGSTGSSRLHIYIVQYTFLDQQLRCI